MELLFVLQQEEDSSLVGDLLGMKQQKITECGKCKSVTKTENLLLLTNLMANLVSQEVTGQRFLQVLDSLDDVVSVVVLQDDGLMLLVEAGISMDHAVVQLHHPRDSLALTVPVLHGLYSHLLLDVQNLLPPLLLLLPPE